MKFTLTKTDALNADITVQVVQDDYNEELEKSLKKIQQKATMKGFRPGAVPRSFINKNYGTGELVGILNKTLQAGINKYVADNALAILCQPVPIGKVDVEYGKEVDYEFKYRIGMAPIFEIDLTKSLTFTYKTLIVTEQMVATTIKEQAAHLKLEVCQALFDALYPPAGTVSTEADFNLKVREELAQMGAEQAEYNFKKNEIPAVMITATPFAMPDDFIKHWLGEVYDKPLSPQEIDKGYLEFANGLRWQLIQAALIKRYSLEATEVQIKEELRKRLVIEYKAKHYDIAAAELTKMVDIMYLTEGEQQKIKEFLLTNQISAMVKEKCTVVTVEKEYEEFVKG